MSRKIILSDETKNNIIYFILNTYQCTISDVTKAFNLTAGVIYNNIDKEYINSLLFHGCKDSTKEKLRKANLGHKQSKETIAKRVEAQKVTVANRDPKVTEEIYTRMKQTKIIKFGTWENYSQFCQKKTKQTKLNRYGNPNYNNIEKGRQTKLQRYGDANYNNKEQIRITQDKLYGGFAFCDKNKYEKTMLERYGVRHNWSSKDPKLNGRKTMFAKSGSKELHYAEILKKGRETKKQLYGDEFYSNHEQAQQTMLRKYGVRYYTSLPECYQLSYTPEALLKKTQTMKKNRTFHQSIPEKEIYKILVEKFGENDVYKEYQDPRYSSSDGKMYKCDFYIKSKDLFIELNIFPTHNTHPYNKDDENDKKQLEALLLNPSIWNKTVVDVWTIRDPEKFHCAIKNNLNYMCFYPEDNYFDIIQRI